MEHLTLAEAVERHIRPGDALHLFYGHSRWTALAREVCRQFWRSDPGFELQVVALGNVSALFFAGDLLHRCITSYVGNSVPSGGPNPVFTRAVRGGAVEVEHWSTLTFQQRVEAAARGLPAAVTRSLTGTSMAANTHFETTETRFGSVNLVAPLSCDVALLHAPVADVAGNVAFADPTMEGPWCAWAARRGALVSVERVVDSLEPFNHLVSLPAHRVLAVVEAPFGAHPGGCFTGALPGDGYAEDVPFWAEIAEASKSDFESWARRWCLDLRTHDDYLGALGAERLDRLAGPHQAGVVTASPEPDRRDRPATPEEVVAAHAARELLARIEAVGADALVAGAGVANLAAWVAALEARRAGSLVQLVADVGMWGFQPVRGEPLIFSHRAFSGAQMLTDTSHVLGLIVSGPGTRAVAALSAAQIDVHGNINTTDIPGSSFLAGSGGGSDVAACADECVVAVVAKPTRLVDHCAFVTSPGERVRAVCTDLGVLRKDERDELVLSAVAAGSETRAERVRRVVANCGWELDVARRVEELAPVTTDEVRSLRSFDPDGLFLG